MRNNSDNVEFKGNAPDSVESTSNNPDNVESTRNNPDVNSMDIGLLIHQGIKVGRKIIYKY